MMKDVLSHFQWPLLTCVGLLIFFIIFVGVLIWVFRRSSGALYQRMEHLPLQEEANP